MISGYSLCNDPEECSSQLLKLILRINKNIWIYNALWSICNLQPPCTPINLHRLLPSEFSISQFFFTHSTETTFPPPCFIQQYGRINHITALPLIFLGQSKQVLKYVDSMTGIWMKSQLMKNVNTLRKDDGDLRFYITTVQDGWRKSAFLTRACFPCTIHLIMQYTEPVSEWSCWRIFIETWPHSELTFRHCASSI